MTAYHSDKRSTEELIGDFMRAAFAQALEASHDGGRVEIHVGRAIADALGAFCSERVAGFDPPVNSAWGFPVVVVDTAPLHHISVHTVYTIA